jgi:hypothetical protein
MNKTNKNRNGGKLMVNKDFQRNTFQLTINNPSKYGFSHEKIKEILVTKFPTLQYFCMADEIGEQGTYHTHIFVVFKSRVRWSTLKKHFDIAHIEVAHGSAESNLEYIKKSGRWQNTFKAETQVEGTFEEWGNFPIQKGTKQDMQELYEMIKAGYSNADILSTNNDYILHIDKLDKLRTMLLTEQYKDERRLDLKVVYIYGATGTNKTRGVLDTHGNSNVYRITDYQHPYDSYACQRVVAYDEFRSQLPLSMLLEHLDIYPVELPARYSNKYACYHTVYIISNWSLEEQYKDIQHNNPESWKAFLRRIHEVRYHHEDGKIDVYNSVKEYLNRDNDFRAISPEEQLKLPFKNN